LRCRFGWRSRCGLCDDLRREGSFSLGTHEPANQRAFGNADAHADEIPDHFGARLDGKTFRGRQVAGNRARNADLTPRDVSLDEGTYGNDDFARHADGAFDAALNFESTGATHVAANDRA
jgi:hypothetical protein